MNIVIYDTEHFETTYALIQVLDIPANKLTIFTTRSMKLILKDMLAEKDNAYTWFICEKSSLQFVFKLYNYCKRTKVSCVFLNTVSYHHIYFGILFFFLKQTKSVLTIHNSNNFFKPKLKPNFRLIIQFLGKKVLAHTVSAYATLLESTKQYIYQTFKTGKPVIVLPGAVYQGEGAEKIDNNPVLSLAVCGAIDQYRRNYEHVFELAHELERRQLPSKIILLGAAVGEYGRNIIAKSMAIKFEFVSIIAYSNFVPVLEYHTQLQQCDFIFQPLNKISHKPNEQPEEYGLTSCSGTFFDAVRYARIVLLPDNIYLSPELIKQCIPYHSIPELAQFLKTLSNAKNSEFVTQAQTNSLNFMADIVRKKLSLLLNIKEPHANLPKRLTP